jgi:N-acetylmuramoyl-L-alanine amidase
MVFVCLSSWAAPFAATAVSVSSIEESYKVIREKCNLLLAAPREAQSREAWGQCIDEIHQFIQKDAQKSFRDRCWYLLGLSYQRMYEIYRNYHSFESAVRYFESIGREYPKSALAEGARQRLETLLAGKNAAPNVGVRRATATSATPQATPASPPALQCTPHVQPGGSSADPVPSPARLEKIQHRSTSDSATAVLYFSSPVSFKQRFIPAGRKGAPSRFNLDIQNAVLGPGIKREIFPRDGLIGGIRISRLGPKTLRIMFDGRSMAACNAGSLSAPYRVVVDIKGKKPAPPPKQAPQQAAPSLKPAPAPALPITDASMEKDKGVKQDSPQTGRSQIRASVPKAIQASATASAKQAAGASKSALDVPGAGSAAPGLARQLGLGVKCIVLDPGHGGNDKGAISPNGVYEKDVTLEIAKELLPTLAAQTGCKVLLTRTKDRYVSLEERTAFANAQKADLFISIHTNAHRDRKLHGVETYFLSLSQDKEAARVAALENASSGKKISDLEAILQDLMLNTKINESSHLAEKVHGSLVKGLRENYEGIRDLGVKKAPFYVLLGARMPCILVEVAFLTNKEEEIRLKDGPYRQALASGITAGIKSYIRYMGQFALAGER